MLCLDPKRSFFSLTVLQGIDSIDSSFMEETPVLVISDTSMLLPYSETCARSSSSVLGLLGMMRTFFREGKLAMAYTAHCIVSGESNQLFWTSFNLTPLVSASADSIKNRLKYKSSCMVVYDLMRR